MDKSGKLAKNAGQIAKQYLQSQENKGLNIVFKGKNEIKEVIRKKRIRIPNTDITVPIDANKKKIKLQMEEEVKSGQLSVGHLINPKVYTKYSIYNSVISKTNFIVEGRKHKLVELRKKLLEKHKKFMRLNSSAEFQGMSVAELEQRLRRIGEYKESWNRDEMIENLIKMERTRYIQIWHDGSDVGNKPHIIFTCNIVYDPAAFYTDEEYYLKTKEKINVQSIVEAPELYIMGQCRSNDEQIGYITTREECLHDLNENISVNDEIEVKDIMRFFHGDGPAVQFESGNQKGGHYFCPNCAVLCTSSP